MVVVSLALIDGDPPPEANTWFVTWAGALAATFTAIVISGSLEPGFIAVALVQEFPEQVHPAPAIGTSSGPVRRLSVTIIVPFVGPADASLLTVTVYVAPDCPWIKLPEWFMETVSLGGGLTAMFVASLALAEAAPPTVTVAPPTCFGYVPSADGEPASVSVAKLAPKIVASDPGEIVDW